MKTHVDVIARNKAIVRAYYEAAEPGIGRTKIEFIPIKPSVAMASHARESYATHSRLP